MLDAFVEVLDVRVPSQSQDIAASDARDAPGASHEQEAVVRNMVRAGIDAGYRDEGARLGTE